MKLAGCIVLCLFVTLSSAPFALADSFVVNGGFETGNFTGWTKIGDAAVVTSSFGTAPAGGNYQAIITTIGGGGSEFPPKATVSGNPANVAMGSDIPGITSGLDMFFSLPTTTIYSFVRSEIGGTHMNMEGSALGITFTGNAGDVVSFDWNFLTDEYFLVGGVIVVPFPMWYDFAFFGLDGELDVLAKYSSAPGPLSFSSTPFLGESGYRSFQITLPTSGTHFLGISVVDIEDTTYPSALLIDNFRVTPVPEPATWVLLGSGMVGLIALRKFKRL